MINGDVYLDKLPKNIQQIELTSHQLVHLWLVDNPNHNPFGDFGLNDKLVTQNSTNKLTFSGHGNLSS